MASTSINNNNDNDNDNNNNVDDHDYEQQINDLRTQRSTYVNQQLEIQTNLRIDNELFDRQLFILEAAWRQAQIQEVDAHITYLQFLQQNLIHIRENDIRTVRPLNSDDNGVHNQAQASSSGDQI